METAKKNGKPAPEPADIQIDRDSKDLVEQTREWSLAQAPDPVEPESRFKHRNQGWAMAYYRSIDWPAWWDEFNSAVIPKGQPAAGHRKYRSVWNFICHKTKDYKKRRILLQMIGPEPRDVNKVLEAPYLGNWEWRRRNGFYAFDDESRIIEIQKAIKERTESLDAVRAMAPLIARRLAYWYKIRDNITDAFAGQVLTTDEQVTTEKQGKRATRFLNWMKRIEEIIGEIENQWMRIHGINPLDPAQQYLNMATAGRIGAAAALTGAAAVGGLNRPVLVQDGQEVPLPEGTDLDTLLFASMLKQHEKTYGLPLPKEKVNGSEAKKVVKQ